MSRSEKSAEYINSEIVCDPSYDSTGNYVKVFLSEDSYLEGQEISDEELEELRELYKSKTTFSFEEISRKYSGK